MPSITKLFFYFIKLNCMTYMYYIHVDILEIYYINMFKQS